MWRDTGGARRWLATRNKADANQGAHPEAAPKFEMSWVMMSVPWAGKLFDWQEPSFDGAGEPFDRPDTRFDLQFAPLIYGADSRKYVVEAVQTERI